MSSVVAKEMLTYNAMLRCNQFRAVNQRLLVPIGCKKFEETPLHKNTQGVPSSSSPTLRASSFIATTLTDMRLNFFLEKSARRDERRIWRAKLVDEEMAAVERSLFAPASKQSAEN